MPEQVISSLIPASAHVVEPPRGAASAEPVREYVGDLAGELAQMARDIGDDTLAHALEAAADLAMRPMSWPIVLATSRRA